MKIIHSDFKKGSVKVKAESLDDLWYLNQIIDTDDLVSGKSVRKVKVGSDDERNQRVSKKAVFLRLRVGGVEFSKHSNVLRVSGVVEEGPEDVPLGSHHTFTVEENTVLAITKEKWLKFQTDKLKEASGKSESKILILVHDREEGFFALMKRYGYELLAHVRGSVAKKGDLEKVENTFYKDLIKRIAEYDKRHGLNKVIIASPAFWKEDLMKGLADEKLKEKVILATCSSVGENGINEVLKRPEAQEALKQDRISREFRIVESLMAEISKGGLASYGLEETKKAAEAGAVQCLLVADDYIQKKRQQESYEEIEDVMKSVDSSKGEMLVISSEHEAGSKLNGLGGIAAILRYRIS